MVYFFFFRLFTTKLLLLICNLYLRWKPMFNPSKGKKKVNVTSKHPFVSVTIYLIFSVIYYKSFNMYYNTTLIFQSIYFLNCKNKIQFFIVKKKSMFFTVSLSSSLSFYKDILVNNCLILKLLQLRTYSIM